MASPHTLAVSWKNGLEHSEYLQPQLADTTSNPSESGTLPPLDDEQFEHAFRQGYNRTLRFLVSRGAKSETAEEITQAAWARGWECRWQLQRPDMIGAWINSIAKNMLRNCARANQKLEDLGEYPNAASPFATTKMDVTKILSRCGDRDSMILRGYYLEGYTSEEIAQQVGLTSVAVRVRLLRIRRALRSHFARPPLCTAA